MLETQGYHDISEKLNKRSSENWHAHSAVEDHEPGSSQLSCKCGLPDWSAVFPGVLGNLGSDSSRLAVPILPFTPDYSKRGRGGLELGSISRPTELLDIDEEVSLLAQLFLYQLPSPTQ